LTNFQQNNLEYYFTYFAINYETFEVLTVKEGVDLMIKDNKKRIIFGFIDPNSNNKFASWSLRNYLTLLSYSL
jgi:hypothetical protein